VEDIIPPVNPTKFVFKFRPIIHDGKIIQDLFCVELSVPKGTLNSLHFTKGGKTWIRMDGVTKELKGYDLYCFVQELAKGM
jgi:hypothetical protein